LPNANVGIEIAMNKGSRRQMMQRLGRIMRPKQASSSESYNAVFYTIVSDETAEMKYFEKRRDYLVNLGFQYDLRLFEYSNHETIEDIYKSDLEKQKVV
jgi:DNA excision repair protein ERCC-3